MKRIISIKYDGYFVYNDQRIDYYIGDGYGKNTPKDKMDRDITYYINGCNVGNRAVYGTIEEMTNISPFDAKKWYIELLNKKNI